MISEMRNCGGIIRVIPVEQEYEVSVYEAVAAAQLADFLYAFR
jgi:hypothetical protein